MAALRCDICGGNLAMEANGNFAICESCGLKHTKERMQVKVQETKGIVSVEGKLKTLKETKNTDFFIRGGVLEKYIGEGVDVVIPSNVVIIGESAFKGLAIRSVKMSDNVVEIKAHPFINCRYLESVKLSNSLKSIISVFRECSGLKRISIPDGITDISYAFPNCPNLISVDIPKSVTNIDGAFKDCTSLTSIVIPKSVTHIDRTFTNCKSLTSIVIPESVTMIDKAFHDCTNLTNVIIKNREVNIKNAFKGCNNLKKVTIGGIEIDIKSAISDKFIYSPSEWREKSVCQYCGGTLNGIITKRCLRCNRRKDY